MCTSLNLDGQSERDLGSRSRDLDSRDRDLGSRGRVCSCWEEIWVLEVVFVLGGKTFGF